MHVHNYKPTLFINCLLTSPWAEGGGDNILDFFFAYSFLFSQGVEVHRNSLYNNCSGVVLSIFSFLIF